VLAITRHGKSVGLRYLNCGGSLESCSAILEHRDGRFAIVMRADTVAQLSRALPTSRAA
jgi:hypothetical protein